MILMLIASYFGISFFLAISIHASFIYESKKGLIKDSKKAWFLCLAAGLGITTWLFVYGYKAQFIWNTAQ